MNYRGNKIAGCPDGYQWDYEKSQCVPITSPNGKFNVDLYETNAPRSYYDPSDRTINFNPRNGIGAMTHEPEHAEQDRNGDLDSFRYIPQNELARLLNPSHTNRRDEDIENIVKNFEPSWKKGSAGRSWSKDMMFISDDVKRLKADKLTYNLRGTVEGNAEYEANKKNMEQFPKGNKNIQINPRGKMGGKMALGGAPRQLDYGNYQEYGADRDAYLNFGPQPPKLGVMQAGMDYMQKNLTQSTGECTDASGMVIPCPNVEDSSYDPTQDNGNNYITGTKNANGQVVGGTGASETTSHNSLVNNQMLPKKEKKFDPFFMMRGVQTGLAWLGNKRRNNEQDQYMQQQYSTLAQNDPINTNDYQPNRFSLYAKYGGKMKMPEGGLTEDPKKKKKLNQATRGDIGVINQMSPEQLAIRNSLSEQLDRAPSALRNPKNFDDYNHPIATKQQIAMDPEFYGPQGSKQILNKYVSMNGVGTGQPIPSSKYSKVLNNLQYMINNVSNQSSNFVEGMNYRPENEHTTAAEDIILSRGKTIAKKGGMVKMLRGKKKFAEGGSVDKECTDANGNIVPCESAPIKPFYSSKEDKVAYQKKLTEMYYGELNKNNGPIEPYLAKGRTKVFDATKNAYLTNDQDTCIDGVCGIMEKAGKKWNAGTVNGHYVGNESFYDNVYLNKKEDAYAATGNFQVGDIVEAGEFIDTRDKNGKVGKRVKPTDAKTITAIEKDDNGDNIYITSGGSGGNSIGGSRYTEQDLKQGINNKTRFVTRPGYSLDKEELDKQRVNYNNPEIKKAMNEKEETRKFEISQPSPYKYSIRKDATDYNDDTKEIMDRFVGKANDDGFINKLVETTGRTKEEIHDSLLNVFGELGQENNWSNKGKGIKSKAENLFERVVTSLPGKSGKNYSVGPGQIKYSQVPEDARKKYNIKTPNDLYDLEKVIPLMTDLDLRNKKTLQNWGNENTLSDKLIGKTDLENPLRAEDLKGGVGRWSPYLVNQYSNIRNKKKGIYKGSLSNSRTDNFIEGRDGLYNPYVLDEGSYPDKVFKATDANLERKIMTQTMSEEEINRNKDFYTEEGYKKLIEELVEGRLPVRDMQPVKVYSSKKKGGLVKILRGTKKYK